MQPVRTILPSYGPFLPLATADHVSRQRQILHWSRTPRGFGPRGELLGTAGTHDRDGGVHDRFGEDRDGATRYGHLFEHDGAAEFSYLVARRLQRLDDVDRVPLRVRALVHLVRRDAGEPLFTGREHAHSRLGLDD